MRATGELGYGQSEGFVGIYSLPGGIVDLIADLCLDRLTCGIHQLDGYLGLIVSYDLLWQIDCQRRLTIAKRQRQLTTAGLTSLVGHISRHHEIIESRIGTLRQYQRQVDDKLTFLIGHSLTMGNLVTIVSITHNSPIPVMAIGPPPEGRAAHDLIRHLTLLYRDTGITHRDTLHRQRITSSISRLHFRELHVERRTLILLNTDIVALVTHFHSEGTRQTGGRQREIDGSHTIGIGRDLFLVHLLVVGIIEPEREFLLGRDRQFEAMLHLIGQRRDMNGLSWTIDAAVGVDIDTRLAMRSRMVIIGAMAASVRTGTIGVGIGENLTAIAYQIMTIKDVLTLLVGHALIVFIFVIGAIIADAQMGTGNGLTSAGTDHHVALIALDRLRFNNDIDIGDEIETTQGTDA